MSQEQGDSLKIKLTSWHFLSWGYLYWYMTLVTREYFGPFPLLGNYNCLLQKNKGLSTKQSVKTRKRSIKLDMTKHSSSELEKKSLEIRNLPSIQNFKRKCTELENEFTKPRNSESLNFEKEAYKCKTRKRKKPKCKTWEPTNHPKLENQKVWAQSRTKTGLAYPKIDSTHFM